MLVTAERLQVLLVVLNNRLACSLSHKAHKKNHLLEHGLVRCLIVFLDRFHKLTDTIGCDTHLSLTQDGLHLFTALDLQFPISLVEELHNLRVQLLADICSGKRCIESCQGVRLLATCGTPCSCCFLSCFTSDVASALELTPLVWRYFVKFSLN